VDAPARNLAWLAKRHFGKIRLASFLLAASPALWLGTEYGAGALGVNPLNRLLHFSGSWALTLLLVTLAVTPVRRLSVWVAQAVHARYGKRVSDWNWLVRLRRQLGLFAFFYAACHLAIYVTLDAGLDGVVLREDLSERPFVLLGWAAFVLLLPLAATSNQASMRALGSAWRKLHLLSYPIAILALAHYWLQMKVGDSAPLPQSALLALLLAVRAQAWRRGERGPGVEAKER